MILVAEDDTLQALGLETALQGAGYSVAAAASSQAALANVGDRRPDLAIIDLELADGATGASLARALSGWNIPVLIHTAADEAEVRRALGDLTAEIIVKPMPYEGVLRAVRAALKPAKEPPAAA